VTTLTLSETAPPSLAPTPPAVGVVASGINRRRLEALLTRSPVKLVAAARTVEDMLDSAVGPLDLAVLLGGVDMLARGGAVELLNSLRPGCSIVVVCDPAGRAIVRKALRAGVDGFVSHAALEQALQPTLAAVLAGQLSGPRSIRARVTWATFSTREKQVLELVAGGLTNAEIADRLYLSESTVKSHLSSSFRKLGVSSRAEAAAAVLDRENGLEAAAPPVPVISLEQELLGARA
jgi:DNA-binding NarL/FixJ family response regulator